MKEVQDIDEKVIEMLTHGNTADRQLLKRISHGLDKAGIYYRIFARTKAAHSTAIKLNNFSESQ